ncbi:MAG TPA: DUF4097 family beta strand repeat-containing protein [Bryobacteraceae bacterium]|jgi:DUF4097 and DUF4098 domain-containing protein YvlB|nr:DUF4097 family beta strand repeat-containing protein [Bryobacteraceae bacterium]
MRPRRSLGGPLVLIGIGVLFLIHTISPDFEIVDIFSRFWPFALILWGVVQLIEIGIWATRGVPVPYNGISGGGWFIVLLICLLGFATYEFQRPGAWWRGAGFQRSIEMLGNEHDFTLPPVEKATVDAPKVVIENFRGDAKITGADGNSIQLNGHKVVRALDAGAATRVNLQTPVEVIVQGRTIIVRCNQDRAGSRSSVTTNLELSIPKHSSLEATGTYGDFEISDLAGDVNVSSENAGIRVQDVKGNLHVDTRKSDEIRCTDIAGSVTLRGRGDDVSLTRVSGEVNVNGDYSGEIALEDINKPVRVESMRTTFETARVAGAVKLARGSMDARDLVGPTRVKASATDMSIAAFSGDLEVDVDKGDVGLRPGRVPLGKIVVHARSGDIDLALPQTATFELTASTDHGSIENDLGASFNERTQGQGSHLEGSSGNGPDLHLNTNRGDITLHKDDGEHPAPPKPPGTPRAPHDAPASES